VTPAQPRGSYSLPDYSQAEKSYRAASIQRDHLTAGIITAVGYVEDAQRFADVVPWEMAEWLRRAHHDLQFALDAAESVR
jgi:hypothetical protein